MAEKKYKYTGKIKQPQTVAGVKIGPKGGEITERELKTLKKDAYGASLLEKKLLIIEDEPVPARSIDGTKDTGASSKGKPKDNTAHDFDETGWAPPK